LFCLRGKNLCEKNKKVHKGVGVDGGKGKTCHDKPRVNKIERRTERRRGPDLKTHIQFEEWNEWEEHRCCRGKVRKGLCAEEGKKGPKRVGRMENP